MFDKDNCLRRYENGNEILKDFFNLRMDYYVKRKDYLMGMLQAESDRLSDQARFIMEKCNNTLVVENKKRKTMIDELIKRGYRADPVKEWKRKVSLDEEEEQADEIEEEEEEAGTSDKKPKKAADPDKAFQNLTDVKKYDYLLGMSMWMLTDERKNDLLKQRDTKLNELAILKAKTHESIWLADLEALEKKLDEVEDKERKEEMGINLKTSKQLAAKQAAGGKRASKGAKAKGAVDILPARDGIKVEFKVTAEILKKYEKLAAAGAKAKAKKEGVEPGEGKQKNWSHMKI